MFEEEWRRFVEVFRKYAGREPREKSVLRLCLNTVLQSKCSAGEKAGILAEKIAEVEKVSREKAEKIAREYLRV